MSVIGEYRSWIRRVGFFEYLFFGWEGRRRAFWIKFVVE